MELGRGRAPLWSESGVIEAAVDQVTALVLEVHPGPISPDNALLLHRDRPGAEITLRGGPEHFSGYLARQAGAGGGKGDGRDGGRYVTEWQPTGDSRRDSELADKWERIRYAESRGPGNQRRKPASQADGPAGAGSGAGAGHDMSIIEVDVDQVNAQLTVAGHWWFRGEYRMLPHADGTLLEYAAYNQSRVPYGLLRFLHRGLRSRQQNSLTASMQTIGRRLGCRAYVVD